MADSYPTTRRTCGSCRFFEARRDVLGFYCAETPTVLQTQDGVDSIRPEVYEDDIACRFYAPAKPEVAS